jgi:hypothetical protein
MGKRQELRIATGEPLRQPTPNCRLAYANHKPIIGARLVVVDTSHNLQRNRPSVHRSCVVVQEPAQFEGRAGNLHIFQVARYFPAKITGTDDEDSRRIPHGRTFLRDLSKTPRQRRSTLAQRVSFEVALFVNIEA